MSSPKIPIVVLGGGPSGVGAALKLAKRGPFQVTLVERNTAVGGNAGSFELEGLQVDFGSHRLHPSCSPAILEDICGMLGPDLLDRPRHGRIRLRGKWVHFPLKPADLLLNLPPSFMAGVAMDALFKPAQSGAETFSTVLQRGLGRTICRDFYFPYARKIWGVDPEQIDAEQARRRISAGSLGKMVRKVLNAVPGMKPKGAGRFYYPRRGFGQITEAYHAAALGSGADFRFGTSVAGIHADSASGMLDVCISTRNGTEQLPAKRVLSTIPVTQLVRLVKPAAPASVVRSADALKYRAMILIYVALKTDRFTEFDAHYFPGADVGITRLSEPKNYGLAHLPGKTVLCAELPCSSEDPVWKASDQELGKLVIDALQSASLPVKADVLQVTSRRLAQAYPVYLQGYSAHFQAVDQHVSQWDGIVTLGRQGLFAHDNTHHTLAMAYAAADCVRDDGSFDKDLWQTHRNEFESHVVED